MPLFVAISETVRQSAVRTMYFVAFCEVALIRILEEKGQDRGYLLVLMEQHLSRKLCIFPKIRGTFLGVPIIRITVFWGLYWGPPILGNYHISMRCFP